MEQVAELGKKKGKNVEEMKSLARNRRKQKKWIKQSQAP